MYCPNCGRKLNAAASFCAVCGKNVAYLSERNAEESDHSRKLPTGGGRVFYCNYCGIDVYHKDNFCHQCGKKLQRQFYYKGQSRKIIAYTMIGALFLVSVWITYQIVGGKAH